MENLGQTPTKGAVGNKDNGVVFPREEMLKTALLNKIWIYDEESLYNSTPDYMMMDHLIGAIRPEKFTGVISYLEFMKVIWREMQPYMKKLIICYLASDQAAKSIIEDRDALLKDNGDMITFLKHEEHWQDYQNWKSRVENQPTSGKTVQAKGQKRVRSNS